MALLTTLFRRQRQQRSIENPSTPLSSADDWLYDALGSFRSSSGVNVNRETALTYPAWWRCVSLISGDVAKLPVHTFRRGDEGKARDTEHYAYYLLRHKPNKEMTAFQFKRQMQMHCLSEGNAYAYIDRDEAGRPLELIPLLPHRTYPVRYDGRLWYVTELSVGESRKLPPEDVLHVKGLGYDGLIGYSVIHKARESLGLAMAEQTYGSIFFRNGGKPHVALKHPARLSPEAKRNLRESWERMHSGLENSHKTAILEEGMDIKELQINARDAQLIEQRQFEDRQVAHWFNVPPSKLGIAGSVSYNSLEQETQAYLDSCIDPWLVAWESECNDKLLTERQKSRDTHVVEFDRRALIRANMAERGAFWERMFKAGVISEDEWREEEGMNPKPEGLGKKYFVQPGAGPGPGEGAEGEAPRPAADEMPAGLIEVPDVRQPDHYSWGACAAMSVGQFFGVGPASLQEWKAALGTDAEQSTRPDRIAAYLARLGLKVTAASGLTLEDLRRFWKAGQPVICPVQDYGPSLPDQAQFDYGHYLTVIGAGLGYVFCQDSSADNALEGEGSDAAPGRVMIPEDEFLGLWHDTDVDGNQYLHFGIACGLELLPDNPPELQEDDEEEELDPNDVTQGKPGEVVTTITQPIPAPAPVDSSEGLTGAAGPARQALLEAHRRILEDVAGRMLTRLREHAYRAAGEPGKFLAWLDNVLPQEHQITLEDAFGPALDLLDALTGPGPSRAVVAGQVLEGLRSGLLEVAGRCQPAQLRGGVVEYMEAVRRRPDSLPPLRRLLERCGGPGSGVPGPCPTGDKDKTSPDKAGKDAALKAEIDKLKATPEGRETLAKGQSLAQRLHSAMRGAVKSALDALDKESKGGISLIAGGLKSGSPKAVAAGVAHLFNSVFQCVHQEVYENAMSQHSIPGAHLAGKIASNVAASAERGLLKAVAWSWNKARGRAQQPPARGELTAADKQLLQALGNVAVRALKEVFAEAGSPDVQLDPAAAAEAIRAILQGETKEEE